MSKNFFIAIAIIFLITSLAFVLHSISSNEKFFTDNKKENAPELSVETENQELEESEIEEEKETENGKIYKLIAGEEGSVKGAVLNLTTSQVLYYQNRNFLLIDFKGQSRNSIGGYPFIDVSAIQWNFNRDKALIKDKNKYFVYDLNKNTISELDEKIEYVVWYKNEVEDKIVYKSFENETGRKIAIADLNGENEEIVLNDLQYEKIDFEIPKNGGKICYHRYPDANFEAGLDCINIKTKEVESVHKGVFAADYLWSNNGNRLLVSYVNEQIGNGMMLSSMNAKGGELKSLNFPTSVDKCVWAKDNKKIYCAMMVYAKNEIILPNDWSSGKYNSTDTFWEIDVESGKKRRLLESAEMVAVDAVNLFLDENEKYLFFTDKKTKSVYSITLK